MGWLTERRRRRLLEAPFPAQWQAILAANVAAYRLLDAGERSRLHDLVQVFVAEKHWEGCGGLELTDEMKVTIAGMACVMILARDHDLFGDVDSILVYPSAVRAPERPLYVHEAPGRVLGQRRGLLGESHYKGPVILAWDAVLDGAGDASDGRNVVIHELAHKIDQLDGDADGAPPLPDRATARAWAAAMQEAYDAHCARAEHGEPSLLRDYAITSPAEYFAVATEVFFERPGALARELPDVYAQLRAFFGLDLAARQPG